MNGRIRVEQLRRRLDSTLSRAPKPESDIEVQSDFAKYFCVLVSGFFENALIALILDIAQQRSAPEIAQFVERQLDYWTNPSTEKIVKLFGYFSNEWRDTIEDYLVDDRKAAINSLVSLRHKIAHGESVGTSMNQVLKYYEAIKDVVSFVDELLNPVNINK